MDNKRKLSFPAFVKKDSVVAGIEKTLGSKQKASRFVSSVISAVQTTPALQECEFNSLINAAMLGETLRLPHSPQLGYYYMVPFKKKGKYDKVTGETEPDTTVATFVLGYKGMTQLAIRSGMVKRINVSEIKEGELVHYDRLTGEAEFSFIEDDEIRDKKKTVGYYAVIQLDDAHGGYTQGLYWTKKKMVGHADQFSPAFSRDGMKNKNGRGWYKVPYADYEAGRVPEGDMWKYSSFWYKDFDGMAKKTMLRQLLSKWAPMTIDLENAMTADNSYVDSKGQTVYASKADSAPEEDIVEVIDAPVFEAIPQTSASSVPAPQDSMEYAAAADFDPGF